MSVLEKYSDLGIDPLKATELLDVLGVSADELSAPGRFEKFKQMAKYMIKFDNFPYLIKKLTLTKNVDKLQHVWEWTELSRQLEEENQKLSAVSIDEKEIEHLHDPEVREKFGQLKAAMEESASKIKHLSEEIELYEA